jgi:hypothetical protein
MSEKVSDFAQFGTARFVSSRRSSAGEYSLATSVRFPDRSKLAPNLGRLLGKAGVNFCRHNVPNFVYLFGYILQSLGRLVKILTVTGDP